MESQLLHLEPSLRDSDVREQGPSRRLWRVDAPPNQEQGDTAVCGADRLSWLQQLVGSDHQGSHPNGTLVSRGGLRTAPSSGSPHQPALALSPGPAEAYAAVRHSVPTLLGHWDRALLVQLPASARLVWAAVQSA